VRFIPLASGSTGNATLVELDSLRLLVDAGLSARALGQRLRSAGVEPSSIDCILLTHEHTDHVRGVERFSMQHGVPVACAIETLEAMDRSPDDLAEWVPLVQGAGLALRDVEVDPFPVPHDAARPFGFVLRGEGLKIGMATDLGHATTLVRQRLAGCHVLMVESNHDEEMLLNGPYPWFLKQRVGGRTGHLSNGDTASLLSAVVDDSCQAVVLAHLSEKNNRPDLARCSAAGALAAGGRGRVTMRVAAAQRPTPAVEL
jgi:phosphoribosyl 1,2-cyclic phosphodiesterase